jgi:hypothetical protein
MPLTMLQMMSMVTVKLTTQHSQLKTRLYAEVQTVTLVGN